MKSTINLLFGARHKMACENPAYISHGFSPSKLDGAQQSNCPQYSVQIVHPYPTLAHLFSLQDLP